MINCKICKIMNVPLMKNGTNRNRTKQYYICRGCNNNNKKRYLLTESGKKAHAQSNRKTWGKHIGKRKARTAVANALRDGRLIKDTSCTTCGNTGRIEGHHTDYSEPLDVQWLCVPCHADTHNNTLNTSEVFS